MEGTWYCNLPLSAKLPVRSIGFDSKTSLVEHRELKKVW